MKNFCLFLLLVCFQSVYSSHLATGNLNVNLLSSNGLVASYEVQINISRVCEPGSIQFSNDLDVCAYNMQNLSLVNTYTINLRDVIKQSNCHGYCLETAVYKDTVSVNLNSVGLYFKVESCCRSKSENLINDVNGSPSQGFRLFCYVTPDNGYTKNKLVTNYNIELPLVLNQTINKDLKLNTWLTSNNNDSIVVSVLPPYNGASVANNFPGCERNYSTPNGAEFNSGFSSINIFGLQGKHTYNPFDSTLTLNAPLEGKYFFSINVKRFRSSKLVYENNYEMLLNVLLSEPKPSIKLFGKRLNQNDIKFNWDICSNEYADSVVLQRSMNNTSNFINAYKLPVTTLNQIDASLPLKTKLYYRVRMVLNNGDTIYSDTLSTELFSSNLERQSLSDITVYPIPSNGKLHVQAKEMIQVLVIYDLQGRLIKRYALETLEVYLNLSELSKGVYLMEVTTNQGVVRKKIVIEGN